ncbi:hypothetical protein ACQKOA_26285 [Bacillus mobilis]|uniref:hypothetical protein n=1 Tax=Bacillus mobilis TaxID=2026190 RepID=UPI003CFE844B
MKKSLNLILAILTFFLLSGCGNKETPEEIGKRLSEQGAKYILENNYEKAIDTYTELLNENKKNDNKVLGKVDKIKIEARTKDMKFLMDMKIDWDKNKKNYNKQRIVNKMDRIQTYLLKSKGRIPKMDGSIEYGFIDLIQEIDAEYKKRDIQNDEINPDSSDDNKDKDYDVNEATKGFEELEVVIP